MRSGRSATAGRGKIRQMAATFNHVGCGVTDVQKARRFYEGALGFRYERKLKPPEGMSAQLLSVEPPLGLTAVYLNHGEFALELRHYDRAGNPAGQAGRLHEPASPTYQSRSAIWTTCCVPPKNSGAGSDRDPHGVAMFVQDPDGQVIELLSGTANRQARIRRPAPEPLRFQNAYRRHASGLQS